MTYRLNKTDMRYAIVDKYNYVFLARPRRFGRSLLCNTFRVYFQCVLIILMKFLFRNY